MTATLLALTLAQVMVPPESGEVHLRNVRQLTFGGQNAEAYFSASGRLLIFQRTGTAEQCDQMYVMRTDGSGLRGGAGGRGRPPRGYYLDHGPPLFYSSTQAAHSASPPPPPHPQGAASAP